MKKGIELGFVYAGVVIGAGFASGRELWQFFGRFGKTGIWGLAVAFALYFVLGCMIFRIVGENSSKDAFSALEWGRAVMALNFCFMFVLFASMTAAAEAMGEETIGIKKEYGGLIFCILLYICAVGGKERLLGTSSALTPLLIVLGIVCAVSVCLSGGRRAAQTGDGSLPKAVISGVLYVSYNILSLTAVMFPFGDDLAKKGARLMAGLLGSLLMLIFGVCLFYTLVLYYNPTEGGELPILTLTGRYGGGILYGICAAALFAAVFTTAVGNYFALSEMADIPGGKIFVLAAGYLCSLLGFSGIVDKIYPFFGILGLLNILLIVYNYMREMQRIHKKRNRTLRNKLPQSRS